MCHALATCNPDSAKPSVSTYKLSVAHIQAHISPLYSLIPFQFIPSSYAPTSLPSSRTPRLDLRLLLPQHYLPPLPTQPLLRASLQTLQIPQACVHIRVGVDPGKTTSMDASQQANPTRSTHTVLSTCSLLRFRRFGCVCCPGVSLVRQAGSVC